MSSPVRVALVNDYALVVAGVAGVLTPYADRVAVVEIDSGVGVRNPVDVVLYDTFGRPQGSSLDLSALVRHNDARLLVFTWNTGRDIVRASLDAGAAGVVSKSVSAEQLVEALERVHAGERVLPDADCDEPALGRWPGDDEGLSSRESEVLALICQGLSNQEITERAFIGINTVKTYIRSLYRKIDVTTRSQAVVWGMSHGFSPDRVRRERPDGSPDPTPSNGSRRSAGVA